MSTHTTSESTLTLSDSHELYTKTWTPTGPTPPKAILIFIHGFSDHCNFYGLLFPTLASQNIKTYACDQRGWGRSVHFPKEKGLTGGTEKVMSDMTEFIRHVLHQQDEAGESEIPIFLMGHSMGGAQVLYYLAAGGPKDVLSRIRGFLCESPFVALHESSRPAKVTVALGRLAGKVLPHRQMLNKLEAWKLCRDADVAKEYEEDPLCHDTGTLEGLAGMLDRAAELEGDRVVVKEGMGEGGKTLLWVGFGTGDQVLSEKACREWFERTKVEDKEYRVYEGWYHKLHAEPGEDKVTFANDVARWISERSGSGEEGGIGVVSKSKL